MDIAHKEKPALLNCEFGTTSSARQKRDSAAASEVEAPVKSNVAWLQYGLKSRTHEKRGWLKDKLLHLNLMEGNKESLWKRILSDYKCQLAAIEDMRLTLGQSFVDPREHKGHNGVLGKYVSATSEAQQGIPQNMWTIPYLLYAYDVKRSNFQNKRNADSRGADLFKRKDKKQYNKEETVQQGTAS